MVRIAVGCDHRGLNLKQFVIDQIGQMGHGYEDFGCYTADAVDYPEIAKRVAEAVAGASFDYGILLCGTGVGMSIAANKVRGIRAALCYDAFSAGQARRHNDANILCLAADQEPGAVCGIVAAFLAAGFEGGRHQRRLDQIKAMEG